MKTLSQVSPFKRMEAISGVSLRALRLFERAVPASIARGYVHYHCGECLWRGVALDSEAAGAIRADLFFVPEGRIVFSASADWRSAGVRSPGGEELAQLIQSGIVKEFWPKRCPCCRGWLELKPVGAGGLAYEAID